MNAAQYCSDDARRGIVDAWRLTHMPADIFGRRFYAHREPAWHFVGQVSAEKIGAVEAFRRVGPYDVVLDPHAGWSEIIRRPTADENRRHSFGRVDEDYQLIGPGELTELWDQHAGAPVETLGVLRRGECLFITMKVGKSAVRGDPVAYYLVLAHWMSANRTSVAFMSPVRVVCSNTLMVAQRMSRFRMDLQPTPGVRHRLAKALNPLAHSAQMHAHMLRTSFEHMADRALGDAEAAQVAEAAYPNDTALRRAALDLFAGAGTGMDRPAARGTLWGMVNAVAELENFRGDGSAAEIAEDVLFGARAEVMRAAFDAALDLLDSGPKYQAPALSATREPELALRAY